MWRGAKTICSSLAAILQELTPSGSRLSVRFPARATPRDFPISGPTPMTKRHPKIDIEPMMPARECASIAAGLLLTICTCGAGLLSSLIVLLQVIGGGQ